MFAGFLVPPPSTAKLHQRLGAFRAATAGAANSVLTCCPSNAGWRLVGGGAIFGQKEAIQKIIVNQLVRF